MKRIKWLTFLMLSGAFGCGDNVATPGSVTAWPPTGECVWDDMGMSGGCSKWAEYCTTKLGLHCITFVVCGEKLPQGCN